MTAHSGIVSQALNAEMRVLTCAGSKMPRNGFRKCGKCGTSSCFQGHAPGIRAVLKFYPMHTFLPLAKRARHKAPDSCDIQYPWDGKLISKLSELLQRRCTPCATPKSSRSLPRTGLVQAGEPADMRVHTQPGLSKGLGRTHTAGPAALRTRNLRSCRHDVVRSAVTRTRQQLRVTANSDAKERQPLPDNRSTFQPDELLQLIRNQRAGGQEHTVAVPVPAACFPRRVLYMLHH